MLAQFNLGGGEIILVLALVVILFGAKKLPELSKGLGLGILMFRDAADDVASDAGRSVGGIYGKPGAQALTPDNQVAELYDPAVLRNNGQSQKSSQAMKLLSWLHRLWRAMLGVAGGT